MSQYEKVEVTHDVRTLTWGLMVKAGAVGYVVGSHMGRYNLVFCREDAVNGDKLIRSDSTRDHTVTTEASNFKWVHPTP